MSNEQSGASFRLDSATEITFQGSKWKRHLMTADCEGCGETINNGDQVLTRSSSLRHSHCPTEDAQTATVAENARRSNLKVQIPSEISELLPNNLKDGQEPKKVLSFIEQKVDKLGGLHSGMGLYAHMSRRAYRSRMTRGSDNGEDASDVGRGSDDDEGSQDTAQEELRRKLESAYGSLQRQMDTKEPVTVKDTMLSRGWSEQRYSPTYGKKVCSLPTCPEKKTTLARWERQPTLGDQNDAIWADQTERLFLHEQCFQGVMNNDYMYQAETETTVGDVDDRDGSDIETED